MLCYEAGKPLILDPFNAPELVDLGRVPESSLTAPVEQRQIAVIQLKGVLRDENGVIRDSGDAEIARKPIPLFTEGFLRAVWDNYRLDHTSTAGAFYVPRQ